MALTKPTIGASGWGNTLNAALDSLDARTDPAPLLAAAARAEAAAALAEDISNIDTPDALVAALVDDTGSDTAAALAGIIAAHVSTPGPDIVLWGDSLTEGRGDALAAITGHTVRNAGVWGESSRGIAARQGGSVMRLMVTGATIPAAGGVTVTINHPGGIAPLTGTGGSGVVSSPTQLPGTLLGVPGVLTLAGGVYTFTRTTPGSAVSTQDRPTLFVPTWAADRRRDVQIIWAGNNNTEEPDVVLGDIAAMIEQVTTEDRRYLVLGMTRSASWSTAKRTGAAEIDAALEQRYGTRFLNIAGVAGYFQTNYPLYDASMDPTGQDSADIGAGFIPASMLADEIHYNDVGKTVLDNLIGRRLYELGWVESWTPLAMPTSPRSYARVDGEAGQKALTPGAGGAVSTDATVSYLGTASTMLEFVFPGDNFVSAMWDVRNDSYAITVDGVFKGTPGEPPLAVAVQCYSAADVGLGTISTGGLTVTGSWQSFSATEVPPAGTAKARLIVLQTAADAAVYHLDQLRVRQ